MNTKYINELEQQLFAKEANFFVPVQTGSPSSPTYKMPLNGLLTKVSHGDLENINSNPNHLHMSSLTNTRLNALFGLPNNTLPMIMSGAPVDSGIRSFTGSQRVLISSIFGDGAGISMGINTEVHAPGGDTTILLANNRIAMFCAGGHLFDSVYDEHTRILNPVTDGIVMNHNPSTNVTSIHNGSTSPSPQSFGLSVSSNGAMIKAPTTQETSLSTEINGNITIKSIDGTNAVINKSSYALSVYSDAGVKRDFLTAHGTGDVRINGNAGQFMSMGNSGSVEINSSSPIRLSAAGGVNPLSVIDIGGSSPVDGNLFRIFDGATPRFDIKSPSGLTPAVSVRNNTSFEILGLTSGYMILHGSYFTSSFGPIEDVLVRNSSQCVKALDKPRFMDWLFNTQGDSLHIGSNLQSVNVGREATSVDIGVSAAAVRVGQFTALTEMGEHSEHLVIGKDADVVSIGASSSTLEIGHNASTINIGENSTLNIGHNAGGIQLGYSAGNVIIGDFCSNVEIGPGAGTISIHANPETNTEIITHVYACNDLGRMVKLSKSAFQAWITSP